MLLLNKTSTQSSTLFTRHHWKKLYWSQVNKLILYEQSLPLMWSSNKPVKRQMIQISCFRKQIESSQFLSLAMLLYHPLCLYRHAVFKWQIMAWLLKTLKIMWHQFINIRNKAFEKDLEHYISIDVSILYLKDGKPESQHSLN